MTRSDLHAASVSVAALPERDATIVLCEAEVGDATSLVAAIEAEIGANHAVAALPDVEVPGVVIAAGHAPAWQAAVRGAAGQTSGASTLATRLPALCQQVEERAREATQQLDGQRAARSSVEADLRRLDAERDYELGKLAVDPGLADKARRYRLAAAGLFAIEAISIYAAVAAALGLADGMPLARVPATVWFQVLGLGTLVSVALFAATFLATRFIRKLAVGTQMLRAGAAAAVVTTLLMALALGVVRWWGAQSAYEVSAFGVDVGSVALLVLVTLATVCLAVGSAVTGTLAEDADAVLSGAAEVRRRYAEASAGPRARLEDIGGEIAHLTAAAQLPLTLRTAFEQGVMRAEALVGQDASERRSRTEQALGAFRQVRALPPEIRPLVASEVFELRCRRDSDDTDRPPRGGLRGVGQAIALMFALGTSGALGLGGCSSAEPLDVPDLILGCDVTGESPEDVCSAAFAQAAFFDWSQEAAYSPGAAFTFIPSAGSFGETRATVRAVVPERWESRGAPVRWVKEIVGQLADIPGPTDVAPTGRQPNRSDLVSLLAVAAREARSNSRPVKLVVATDGWLVSLGVDTESGRVPEPTDFLAKLRAADVPWDLSAFSSITVCGLHNQGADAGKVGARDVLLGELFHAGNAPEARLRTSCRDLYPAVPPPLLPAPPSDDLFAADLSAATDTEVR